MKFGSLFTKFLGVSLCIFSLIFLPKQSVAFTDVGLSGSSLQVIGSQSCCWIDYDNDGYQDLFVLGFTGQVSLLYHNNGDGTFTDVASSAGLEYCTAYNSGATCADYDNDGFLDLCIGNVGFFRNNGNGTFTDVTIASGMETLRQTELGGTKVIWGDYNNDGNVDLYLIRTEAPASLYHNNGDGTFSDVTSYAGVADGTRGNSGAWADYDNDGYLDLYIGNYFASNHLYHNNGDGTFTDEINSSGVNLDDPYATYGVAWGDYDNDGYLDLYVSNAWGSNHLYHNNGDRTFTNVTSQAGSGMDASSEDCNTVAWADYDNDGDLDLCLTVHYYTTFRGANHLFRNNGNGTFTDVAPELGITLYMQHPTPAWGDYNNDGYPDLYLAASWVPNQNHLLRNDCSGNNWLGVKLIGTISNRAGIGARIECKSGGIAQIREVSGGNDDHQDAIPVEFGFGTYEIIDSLTVRWPSGIVQELANVDVNQFLTLIEPNQASIVEASINIDPDTLNLKDNGKYVTCYIQLPDGCNVEDIDVDSIKLEDTLKVQNSDIQDGVLMVKFSRQDLIEYIKTLGLTYPADITLEVTGEFTEGTAFNGSDTIRVINPGKGKKAPSQSEFALLSAYPQPFNPEVWIPYKLGDSVQVKFMIYNASGNLVRTLNLGYKQSGSYVGKDKSAYWDGRNESGEQVSSGVYFYTIQAGSYTATGKMIMQK